MTIFSLLPLLLCLLGIAVSSLAEPIVWGDVSIESLPMDGYDFFEKDQLSIIAEANVQNVVGSPPYYGTIFVDGDIISKAQHRSTMNKIERHDDQQCVRIFDRAVESYVTIQAYIFDVTFTDTIKTQFWIRASDYTRQEATDKALFFGEYIGRLPQFLRRGLYVTTIQDGDYNAGGLSNRMTIHADRYYQNQGEKGDSRDIWEEAMVHEAAHCVIDAKVYGTQDWNDAVEKDAGFISNYARDFPQREDVAESLLLWLGIKIDTINEIDEARTVNAMPNRMSFFDSQGYNLFPLDGTDFPGEIDNGYQWERLDSYFYPCGFWEDGDKTVVYMWDPSCEDSTEYSFSCPDWASENPSQCDVNPGFMLVHCKKSCEVCTGTGPTSVPILNPTPVPTSKPTTYSDACKDSTEYKSSCPDWASENPSQCDVNPGFMLVECKKSCEVCTEPTSVCEGDPSWRYKGKTCEKYFSTNKKKKKEKRCRNKKIFEGCPSYCNLRCRCENLTKRVKINIDGKKKKVKCDGKKKYCDNSKFSENCPARCDTCL